MIKSSASSHIKKENKIRIRFAIKALIFSALIFCSSYFKQEILNFGIPLHFIDAIQFYLYADLFISLIRLIAVYFYIKKHKLKRDVKYNFEVGINHIANILHTLIFIGAALLLLNINPISLITSLSIVAAAFAILSKDYISNMINGMIIMFSDELSLGDEIKIGDVKGKITDITLTNVHIVNDDEDLIYIPNSIIFTSQILNFTKRKVRKVSFDFDLKNNMITNIENIEKHIIDSLEPYQSFIQPESYNLRITKIHENFSSLKFQFILHKNAKIPEKDIRRMALRKVLTLQELKATEK
ncbi:mechanosensitive ion channel [Marivirga sp. S37H4]|uniref:Mechanosensitive ion channel n=1 Tax=Marivirga aurantiaca TaxID=2802615 RepID=A0A934X229_9BACT|nr:mechanosensitive ion channel domain-containing protein [Marivirga aurantiaca]MBK6266881.1 mechanosensitive ion channel [Marivirga aurantiaca]